MRIHFFAAPFLLLSFGSGFKVQSSGFRWRLRRLFFRRWYSRIAAFPSRGRCLFQHFSLQPQLCCSRGGLCRRDDALLGHEGEDDGHALRAFLRV